MKVKPKNILYHAQIKTPHGKAANYWVVFSTLKMILSAEKY